MLIRKFSSTLLVAGAIAISAPVTQTQSTHTELQNASHGRSRECSNRSLRGSFGFTSIGTLLGLPAPFAGPFGEIGRQISTGTVTPTEPRR